MKEEIAVSLLREVKEVLDSHNIRFWLDLGTLLGAVRERQVIEWDHDIDLGTADNEWEKVIATIPEFVRRGFWIHYSDFKTHGRGTPVRIFVVIKLGYNVDIMSYVVNGKYALCPRVLLTNRVSRFLSLVYLSTITYGWSDCVRRLQIATILYSLLLSRLRKYLPVIMWQLTHRLGSKELGWIIPKDFFEELETIELYGMVFNTPSDPEVYLRYHYREDWRVPKKNWSHVRDDGAYGDAGSYMA